MSYRKNWKSLLTLSWPLIVANAFWNLQMTIDRIALGQYSAEALAAAVGTMGIFWAPMALVQQTAAYVTTFAAQYSGAQNKTMIGPALWQSIYLSIIGGLLFLLFIPAAPFLFRFFGHSEHLQLLETQYFTTICFSALPTALMAAFSGFFTGIEKSQIVTRMNFVALLVNAILDIVLVFGLFGFPRLGVVGAGIATTIAAFAGSGYGLWILLKPQINQAYAFKTGWVPNLALMKRYLKYGLPSGMQWALEGLAFTAFLIFIGRMPNGDAALASSGIAVTVMMLAVLPVMGLAQGVSVLVGKHLGENNVDSAKTAVWTGVQLGLIYITVASMSFLLFPNFYLSWFENTANPILWQQIAEISTYLLLFIAIFVFFDCLNIVFSFALKGAGDTFFVSMIALIFPWPLMVLPTYMASQSPLGIYWSWGAVSVYAIILGLTFFARFQQGKWQKMRVI